VGGRLNFVTSRSTETFPCEWGVWSTTRSVCTFVGRRVGESGGENRQGRQGRQGGRRRKTGSWASKLFRRLRGAASFCPLTVNTRFGDKTLFLDDLRRGAAAQVAAALGVTSREGDEEFCPRGSIRVGQITRKCILSLGLSGHHYLGLRRQNSQVDAARNCEDARARTSGTDNGSTPEAWPGRSDIRGRVYTTRFAASFQGAIFGHPLIWWEI
jgi:hypothetical protein